MANQNNNTTISITVTFWTDDVQKEHGGELQLKVAQDNGNVRVRANKLHGIKGGKSVMFNTHEDIVGAIKEALSNSGITTYNMGVKPKYE